MAKSEQKDAVFRTVRDVLKNNNVQFVPSSTDARELLDKQLRKAVIESLIMDFESCQIPLHSKQKNLKDYVAGFVSNWLRKDPRLNGGLRHEDKKPGSRKGSQDPIIKNLRLVQSTLAPGTEAYIATQQRIDSRLLEIKKSQLPNIDSSTIPADLQKYIPSDS